MKEMISSKELQVYAEAIKAASEKKGLGNRASTTVDPKKVYGSYRHDALGNFVLEHVPVFGVYLDTFKKASELMIPQYNPVKTHKLSDVLELIHRTDEYNVKTITKAFIKEPAILGVKRTEVRKEEILAQYSSYTRAFCAEWEVRFEGMNHIIEIRENKNHDEQPIQESFMRLFFSKNDTSIFFIDIPSVKKGGSFTKKGNEYVFQMSPINLEKYLERIDDILYLQHPVEFLLSEATVAFTNYNTGEKIHYSKETFNAIVNFGANSKLSPGLIKQFQKNIENTLRNAKEFSWLESMNTPIIWRDSNLAQNSIELMSHSISAFITYEMLDKNVCDWRGLDLLSGSVATPGKRVSLASGYEIKSIKVGGGYRLAVVPTNGREESDLTEAEKYISSFKLESVGTAKTSCKRQNESPALNTFEYTDACNYTHKNRVRLI